MIQHHGPKEKKIYTNKTAFREHIVLHKFSFLTAISKKVTKNKNLQKPIISSQYVKNLSTSMYFELWGAKIRNINTLNQTIPKYVVFDPFLRTFDEMIGF